jgi:hypothetical protein
LGLILSPLLAICQFPVSTWASIGNFSDCVSLGLRSRENPKCAAKLDRE